MDKVAAALESIKSLESGAPEFSFDFMLGVEEFCKEAGLDAIQVLDGIKMAQTTARDSDVAKKETTKLSGSAKGLFSPKGPGTEPIPAPVKGGL